ncbi:hypothetical protein DM01DRAFT_1174395 [Hesseltinella vesiculosa]|uniref:Uncharacterized protein n=1 Tax=Hesseltinella vesiculosa TaxID=101127 RepID=A0A1X2G574_9FUNG|nr:hypothetical protein DM01DRAFT_1174395 [Hesseltinella vesiculosa]
MYLNLTKQPLLQMRKANCSLVVSPTRPHIMELLKTSATAPLLLESAIAMLYSSSQETDISDNHLLEKLPFYNLPGQDKFNKSIMKTKTMIDLVTMNLPTLCLGLTVPQIANWNGGKSSDVLHVAQLGIQQHSLPPILVEIQSTVDEAFTRRLIQYCENTRNVYGVLCFYVMQSRRLGH